MNFESFKIKVLEALAQIGLDVSKKQDALEGKIETGNVKLNNLAGNIYGDTTELSGDITIDDDSVINGGVALIYHKSATAPTITTGFTKQNIPVNSGYVVNESNLIAVSKIGTNKIGIIYQQLSGEVTEPGDPETLLPPTNVQVSNITENEATVTWDSAGASDTLAPSIPTNLEIVNITNTSATANWSASVDN